MDSRGSRKALATRVLGLLGMLGSVACSGGEGPGRPSAAADAGADRGGEFLDTSSGEGVGAPSDTVAREAGGSDVGGPDGGPSGPDGGPSGSEADAAAVVDSWPGDAPGDAAGPADASPVDAAAFKGVSCATPRPPGAPMPAPPKPYSGGVCPKLAVSATQTNAITSSGDTRRFLLLAPHDLAEGETLPVLFAWYWLKGSAKKFVQQGELQQAVEQQRFLAVVPESLGDIDFDVPFTKQKVAFPWPFLSLLPKGRLDEEVRFFDDMLACVREQFPVNPDCVATVGVSAGALFAAQLAQRRSEYLSSLISLSGGVQSGGSVVNGFLLPWKTPPHRLPALVLWGGPADTCALLNFQAASQRLEARLTEDGHFLVECVHDCKHGVPPVDAPPGQSRFAAIWRFAFSQPFWLPAGASPMAAEWPADMPKWCAIGAGKAKPRQGPCPPPGCPL